VYHASWLGFAVELASFLVVRTAVLTVLVRAAWPVDHPHEPLAVTARRSAIFVVVVAFLLAPWAGLLFALAVTSLSWLFFVAVPVVVMLAVLVAGGAVTSRWWSQALSWRSIGWVLATFLAVTVAGSVLATCPTAWRMPLAALAGLVDAWLWLRLVGAVLRPRSAVRRIPVAPVGIVVVLVVVVVGTLAGFQLSRRPPVDLARAGATTATRGDVRARRASPRVSGTALEVVTGFDTEWDGRARELVHLDVAQRRFSYAGMADGTALPYGPAATHRSLRALVRELRAQVDAYHRQTHHPITVVAESEGALLAKAYLAATPHAPVRALVLLSPLVAPGRVYYPRAGREGWGVFGGAELGGLAWALGGLSPVEVSPDTPFLRSIVDQAPALGSVMACGLPGVRQAAVVPLDTGVTASPDDSLAYPSVVVPAFHGGLLDDATTAEVVADVVGGRPLGGDDGWSLAEDVISAGASAWQVPALDDGLNRAWRHDRTSGECAAVRAHLRAWADAPE